MSARIRMRVLRVPCEKVGVADPWAFSEAHESEFPAWGTCPYFAAAPTVRPFIDYVLFEQISDAQSFGRTRSLTYLPVALTPTLSPHTPRWAFTCAVCNPSQ